MTLLLAKSKVIVEQDGRSGETRGREYMNYIEPRLARLALLHTPCAMLSGPLHLNKAGKWARFGRTQNWRVLIGKYPFPDERDQQPAFRKTIRIKG